MNSVHNMEILALNKVQLSHIDIAVQIHLGRLDFHDSPGGITPAPVLQRDQGPWCHSGSGMFYVNDGDEKGVIS